jgi:hypothetical protein
MPVHVQFLRDWESAPRSSPLEERGGVFWDIEVIQLVLQVNPWTVLADTYIHLNGKLDEISKEAVYQAITEKGSVRETSSTLQRKHCAEITLGMQHHRSEARWRPGVGNRRIYWLDPDACYRGC